MQQQQQRMLDLRQKQQRCPHVQQQQFLSNSNIGVSAFGVCRSCSSL
jgi:hypothetical protein